MIRVLLVDDSISVRQVLRRFLRRAGDIEIAGEAEDGERAVEAVIATQPHLVLMDLQMPVMDGYVAIERIMAVRPTPILVLSSRANRNALETAFEALRRGAVEVLPKPEDPASWEQLATSLPETVRALAAARSRRTRKRVVLPLDPEALAPAASPAAPYAAALPASASGNGPRWVAIGASTGGPAAIRELLDEIPPGVPASFLIVQHIAAGFELGFADWLNKELPLDVRLAQDGERPAPGVVRLAPGGSHLLLEAGGALRLEAGTPARRGHRPSADELFLSCAEACPGEVAGLLLTGMGADGADGLGALRRAGGLTMVQDEASSAVFGMPRVALERRAAEVALPPRALALALLGCWSLIPLGNTGNGGSGGSAPGSAAALSLGREEAR
jgi:two-component system, chemotaxis family, protein-glutamate methylesterase/glutaminase